LGYPVHVFSPIDHNVEVYGTPKDRILHGGVLSMNIVMGEGAVLVFRRHIWAEVKECGGIEL
jgi:hypothetical protein